MINDIYMETTIYSDSTIFVVDDEAVNLKLIERILTANGYSKVICIQSAEQVMELFREVRPNLILLDINMPGLNGFDVLRQLREISGNSIPPVVFLTAQDSQEFRIKAFEQGVLDYISKPFNKVELLSRVKNLIALDIAYQKLENRNQSLEEVVSIRTEALRTTQLEIVQKLGKAAEYRDNETGAHILRMSNISSLLAVTLGYDDDFSRRLLHASPMHDIGKIAIPDNILLKKGKLDADEWEVMKNHTTLGARILSDSSSELLILASEIALYHHEKWDGSGYPDNLCEESIPVSCRIVAVADVFDALLSERPYKKAWKISDAKDFINENSEKHFDPKIVRAFNRSFKEILDIRERYKDSENEINEQYLTINNARDGVQSYRLI